MSSGHRPWPYPRDREQVVQVVVTVVALLLLAVIGMAVQTDRYNHKVLNQDNLQQAASSLSGYASEAAELSGQAAHGRSLQHYQEAYWQQLGDQTQQVTEFIASHQASGELAKPAKDLVHDGQQLQAAILRISPASSASTLLQTQHQLQQLQDELKRIGASV